MDKHGAKDSKAVGGRRFAYPWWSQIGIVIGGLVLIYGLLSLAFDTGRWLYYFAALGTFILVIKLVTRRASDR